MTENTQSSTLYCSFCGKEQYEVFLLIAGPSVFICDECTDLCASIMLETKPGNPKLLAETRELLGLDKPREIDLTELGMKPRFNKVKFRQKESYIFYLCPFSEPFNAVYQDHIRPTVNTLGFTIDRADEIYGTQPIIEDIWEAINSSEIVIADVTGRNPNVMYEIGMAHTIGKPVIILTQDINDVPFDLKHHRCIIYSHTPRGCRELQQRIEGTLQFLKKAIS